MVTSLLDSVATPSTFAADVEAGLLRAGQKELSPKYFYDDVGSALFEAICALPEYGLSRAGERLIAWSAPGIAATLERPVRVAELGSGSARKTRHLIDALVRRQRVVYHPIDVSGAALAQSERELDSIARVSVLGFEAEYLDGARAVTASRERGERLLVLFLGSTIGNFARPTDERFLAELRSVLAEGDLLLLAADLVKPEPVLVAAYDDAIGVTAAFNRNVLSRINRELGGDFDLDRFRHEARWNAPASRVEMHLVSEEAQSVRIEAAGIDVRFAEGESIWTESSNKYTLAELREMCRLAGFAWDREWIDAEWPYAQGLCRAV